VVLEWFTHIYGLPLWANPPRYDHKVCIHDLPVTAGFTSGLSPLNAFNTSISSQQQPWAHVQHPCHLILHKLTGHSTFMLDLTDSSKQLLLRHWFVIQKHCYHLFNTFCFNHYQTCPDILSSTLWQQRKDHGISYLSQDVTVHFSKPSHMTVLCSLPGHMSVTI
jgi:hypothetical protein